MKQFLSSFDDFFFALFSANSSVSQRQFKHFKQLSCVQEPLKIIHLGLKKNDIISDFSSCHVPVSEMIVFHCCLTVLQVESSHFLFTSCRVVPYVCLADNNVFPDI